MKIRVVTMFAMVQAVKSTLTADHSNINISSVIEPFDATGTQGHEWLFQHVMNVIR